MLAGDAFVSAVPFLTPCDLPIPAQPLPPPGLLDGPLKFRPMTLPDRWIECGDYKDQLMEAGLTAGHIAGTALTTLGRQTSKFKLNQINSKIALREGIA